MNIKTESPNFSDWLVQQRSEFFIYSESGLTFESWFQGCEGIFRIDQADVPKHKDISFNGTVLILSKLYGERNSVLKMLPMPHCN